MKKTAIAITLAAATLVAGCNDADVASRNLSRAADNFEINRRIVFYNGITDRYMLEIQGLCSIGSGSSSKSITVTCKTGEGRFKKHQMGLSDNVTYISEQLESEGVSTVRYRVVFKPEAIVPDVDLRTSGNT
ncbi:hypothetical protein [uncultured Halomonas sp.]|uniref:beta-sandwich lipoprotein n=1 Tax=uncultured Halomonas sp. TaxID=173971 RepID=UPI002637191B|nr:hypothetical protein [uncultured Halomonas sp.]